MMIDLNATNDQIKFQFSERLNLGPDLAKSTPAKCQHDTQHAMTRLGESFVPGEYDVICARGGEAKNHIGNLNFRKRVADSAEKYSSAPSKIFKSLIVTAIIEWVKTQSPDGGFVKRFDGVWYEVGEDIARDKVGQALREMNHSKYKSSMKAKRRRWKQEKIQQQIKCGDDNSAALREMLQNHYEAVEKTWRTFDSNESDDQMLMLLFTQQNNNLLQTLKSDDRIQEQIRTLAV